MAGDARSPLLGHEDEDALWDRVEAAGEEARFTTVQELLREHPTGVLRHLQRHGVRKLGSFSVPDKLALGKIGDDSIVTMGADSPDIDFEAAWRRELGDPASIQAGWTATIPVCAYVVAVRDAAAPDQDGLLQASWGPLLKRWQAGGLSYAAFALPPVQAVIDWKWTRFCKRLLLWELAFFLLWLFSFFTFTIFFQDEDTKLSLREILATPRGKVTVACDALSLVGMTPFVFIEVSTMAAYKWGWATMWNVLDVTTYAVQVAVVTMHIGRLNINSDYLSILAAVQCILLLFKLQYFSRVFRATRFAFLDSLKEVLHDVKWYLAFLLLIMVGFATSFHVLFRRDQDKHDNFSTVAKSFITMTTWAAGNAELQPLYKNSHNPAAASVLGMLFVFVLGTVCMSLLVSVMTNTLDKVTKNEGLRAQLSKAQAIDELESTIPKFVESWFPDLFPAFLHVLRVDPDKLDAVKVDQLWSKLGDDERETLLEPDKGGEDGARKRDSDSQSGGSRAVGVEAKLEALQGELADVKALLLKLNEQRGVLPLNEQ